MDSPPTVLEIGLGSVAVIILLGTCCACFAKKNEEENPQLDQQQQQQQVNSAHNQQQRNPSIVQQQERLSMQQPIAIRLSFTSINELDSMHQQSMVLQFNLQRFQCLIHLLHMNLWFKI
jgi:hypothetical protein